jgi:NO-binding membrane sensor protein with MHYT domain
MNAQLVVGAIVDYRYDYVLVALSFVISVLGSYVALALASSAGKNGDNTWGPAIALGGCAIWSMHFIGMTAYKTQLYVSYAVVPAVLSLVISVLITAIGFRLAARGPDKLSNLVLGGLVIGAGVVVMHYLGMFGIETRATIQWDFTIVAASVVIAMVAATVALWLAFNVRSVLQRVLAASVMGVAVCVMHYTGMAAAKLVCIERVSRSELSLDGPYLAYVTFFIALTALGGALAFRRMGAVAPAAPAARRA